MNMGSLLSVVIVGCLFVGKYTKTFMRIKSTYETSSLCLASFIISKGIPLEYLIGDTPKKIFVFKDSSELTSLVRQFQNLSGSTEPQQFYGALRYLKSV